MDSILSAILEATAGEECDPERCEPQPGPSHGAESRRRRRAPRVYLSDAQKCTLVDMVLDSHSFLYANSDETVSNEMKLQKWREITARVNSLGGAQFEPKKLRHRWEQLKSLVKSKLVLQRKEVTSRNTAAEMPVLTDLEMKVASIIDSSIPLVLEGKRLVQAEDFAEVSLQ